MISNSHGFQIHTLFHLRLFRSHPRWVCLMGGEHARQCSDAGSVVHAVVRGGECFDHRGNDHVPAGRIPGQFPSVAGVP
jgi:hypothetical protein